MPLQSTFFFPVHHIQQTVKLTCSPDRARAFFRDPLGLFEATENISYVQDAQDTHLWHLTEKVPRMFGVIPLPTVKFDCRFEETDDGAYICAFAPFGVRTDDRWTVSLRDDSDDKEITCVLREVASVQSFILFAPYVSSTFGKSHATVAGRMQAIINRGDDQS